MNLYDYISVNIFGEIGLQWLFVKKKTANHGGGLIIELWACEEIGD